MDRRLEEFHEVLTALRLEAGFSPAVTDESTEVRRAMEAPSAERRRMQEVLLLTASWLRARGELARAKKLVENLEAAVAARGEGLFAELLFQKALGYYIQGEWASALDCFVSARQAFRPDAEFPRGFLLSSLNILFCLENLGLPTERTHAEAQAILAQVSPADPGLRDAFEQFHAFGARQAFREGRIDEVFALSPRSEGGQLSFFRLWVAALPYHAQSRHGMDGESLGLSSPYAHQKGYRLRTLQGMLHPLDLETFLPKEFADRVYLWTWKWLVDPAALPLRKLMTLFKQVDLAALSPRLTVEDFELLRNSLLWIGLFHPGSLQRLEEILSELRPSGSECSKVLAFERDLVLFLTALRDQDEVLAGDLRAQVQAHPFWKASGLHFAEILREGKTASAPPELAAVARRVSALIRPVRADPSKVIVDIGGLQILLPRGQKIVSAPMVLGLDLLRRKGSVALSEFVSVCFGVVGFDSSVHGCRVFNLLARMRKIAGSSLRFSIREGRVHSSGAWEAIRFEGRHRSERVEEHREWRHLLSGRTEKTADNPSPREARMQRALLLEKLKDKPNLRREDIERLTGKSRSTANRLISRWVKRGVLRRSGSARNTRYQVIS